MRKEGTILDFMFVVCKLASVYEVYNNNVQVYPFFVGISIHTHYATFGKHGPVSYYHKWSLNFSKQVTYINFVLSGTKKM